MTQFKGVREPGDALTITQAHYLQEALVQQADRYLGKAQSARLRGDGREQGIYIQLSNGIRFLVGAGYFKQITQSQDSDGEPCISLEKMMEKAGEDGLPSDRFVAIVEVAALAWSRQQPRYSSGLNMIHAAIKKMKAYKANYSADLEKRITPDQETLQPNQA